MDGNIAFIREVAADFDKKEQKIIDDVITQIFEDHFPLLPQWVNLAGFADNIKMFIYDKVVYELMDYTDRPPIVDLTPLICGMVTSQHTNFDNLDIPDDRALYNVTDIINIFRDNIHFHNTALVGEEIPKLNWKGTMQLVSPDTPTPHQTRLIVDEWDNVHEVPMLNLDDSDQHSFQCHTSDQKLVPPT